jgi:hypothetical protein
MVLLLAIGCVIDTRHTHKERGGGTSGGKGRKAAVSITAASVSKRKAGTGTRRLSAGMIGGWNILAAVIFGAGDVSQVQPTVFSDAAA